ncbi:hypothetical protein SBRCBS47491_005978 [Sporothrix bragantina]|uniref:F-box domain-containing protein n=1 Tax=Sporothrix bragantina TaxID=671064 RepID=A0ABP0C141_9PEZI
MSLISLPNELLFLITAELPKPDAKSLRLAHSAFGYATSRRLFTTVFISKTKRDLEAFLAITNDPRLAVIPTRLVWYELTEDQNHIFLGRVKDEASRNESQPNRSQYCHRTFSMLYNLAAGAFWTEPYFTNDNLTKNSGSLETLLNETTRTYPDRRRATQESTEQVIGAAVRKLVNLHTIVAQPMPVDRVLAVSDEGYHLVAGTMQIETHETAAHDPNGLFLFSKACLGETLTRQIKSVYLAGPFASPSIFDRYYAASADSLALFENLLTIDLCVHWAAVRLYEALMYQDNQLARSMAKCLRAATKLQHLTICFEALTRYHQGRRSLLWGTLFADTRDGDRNDVAMGDESSNATQAVWPMLQSLSLTDAEFREQDLIRFVSRHSATLKHLGLYECDESTKVLVTEMAAMPQLKLSSLQVRAYRPDGLAHHSARDDFIVPEKELLAFINNETTFNPLSKTVRRVFSTAPVIWGPEESPSAAYFDLVTCTNWHGEREGQLDSIYLLGEMDIDLGHQDEVLEEIDHAALSYKAEGSRYEPSDANLYEWLYYETDSSQGEYEFGHNGMQDVDKGFGAPRMFKDAPMPYSVEDAAWIRAWAEQIAKDTEVDLDMVAAEPLHSDARQQALLLAARKADVRHMERCQGRNEDASPRWCWARVHIKDAKDGSAVEQEIYIWKTNTPGRGHPTTNWTFYQEYEDGTTAHGFGFEPLEFFADWNSQIGGDDGSELMSINEVDNDGKELVSTGVGKTKKSQSTLSPAIRMYAEPSVDSRAFRKFLKDAFDMGEPMEVGADAIKLEIYEDTLDDDESSTGDGDSNTKVQVLKGYNVKEMMVSGISVEPVVMDVGILV